MHIRKIAVIVVIAGATIPLSAAQGKRGTNPTARDIDQWSDTDITTWIRSALDRGLPSELGDYLVVASHARSAIIVPLTEKKIEEVLRSTAPSTCFSDPSVDPQIFLRDAPHLITGAGDENALRATGQLMKIDEGRFGFMIGNILYHAQSYRNAFTVAYRGLAIGDPAIDRRIIEWAEALLAQNAKSTQEAWAEAMLDKYSVVPNASQWEADPIAARLSPKVLEQVRDNVTRLAGEIVLKRGKF
jgi:hypothetical protein